MPSSSRPPAPTAPFEVPVPEQASLPPTGAGADVNPGLTPWTSEAIRLLAAELGHGPSAPAPLGAPHAGAAANPLR